MLQLLVCFIMLCFILGIDKVLEIIFALPIFIGNMIISGFVLSIMFLFLLKSFSTVVDVFIVFIQLLRPY